MTRLVVRPLANADIDDAADYLVREGGLDLGLRFLDAVDRGCARLLEFPQIGAEVRAFDLRLDGLRFWPVLGFERVLIFYQPKAELVEIVRVLHGSRDLAHLLGNPGGS